MRPKLNVDAAPAEKTLRLYQVPLDGGRHFLTGLAEYPGRSVQAFMRLTAEMADQEYAAAGKGLLAASAKAGLISASQAAFQPQCQRTPRLTALSP